MSLIEWKPSYSVGNQTLDAQHKVLIDLINNLDKESRREGMIGQAFEDLDNYVREHFRHEEGLLREANYPDLDSHLRDHAAFEEWLRAVKSELQYRRLVLLLHYRKRDGVFEKLAGQSHPRHRHGV